MNTLSRHAIALCRAVEALRDAYPEPRTRKQILAWNQAQSAVEEFRRARPSLHAPSTERDRDRGN